MAESQNSWMGLPDDVFGAVLGAAGQGGHVGVDEAGVHGDDQGALVVQFEFTSRFTSAHRAAAAATWAWSVMSSPTGVTPGSVTCSGWRAAP